jgi:protein phosphatase
MATLQVRSGAATDVGQVRSHNEDSMLAEGTVFAVADGMGGHAAGEVASRIAIEALRDLLDRSELTRREVVAALVDANEHILRSGESHRERAGMGTTVSGLAVVTDAGSPAWVVFNVGDSRVYRFAEGRLRQVTVDHSEVRELVEAGLITEEEAVHHPLSNILTRALGSKEMSKVDVWTLVPQEGERFLACTDGLTGELDDSEIEGILRSVDDPQAAAESLVRAAVGRRGRDNVTAVVVHLESA